MALDGVRPTQGLVGSGHWQHCWGAVAWIWGVSPSWAAEEGGSGLRTGMEVREQCTTHMDQKIKTDDANGGVESCDLPPAPQWARPVPGSGTEGTPRAEGTSPAGLHNPLGAPGHPAHSECPPPQPVPAEPSPPLHAGFVPAPHWRSAPPPTCL